jgi:hypothetical protein
MSAKPQSSSLKIAVFLSVFTELAPAHAQGTLHIDLSGLPPGQILADQFAASGVRFLPYGNPPPTTIAAPAFLTSGAQTIGTAVAFYMQFDQPITSIALDIAEAHAVINGPPPSPNYHLYAFDSDGNPVGVPSGNSFPEEQWYRATKSYPAGQRISSIRLEGWVSSGENFTHEIFFNNIDITSVPEPSSAALLLAGGALFLTVRRIR